MIKFQTLTRIVSPVIIVLAFITAMLFVPNLRLFDESLLPEIQMFPHVQPPQRSTNAITYAYGITAPEGVSPQAAGEDIIALMHKKAAEGKWGPLTESANDAIYRQRKVSSLQPEDYIAKTQAVSAPMKPTYQHRNQQWWENYSAAFACNPFESNNCFTTLRHQLITTPITDSRLLLNLQRYRRLIQFTHFNDVAEMAIASPLGTPMTSGRINLALAYVDGDADNFLASLKKDTTFWLEVLRGSQSMMNKYNALRALRYNLQSLNTFVNEQPILTDEQQHTIRQLMQPPNADFIQSLRSAQHQFQQIEQVNARVEWPEYKVRMLHWLRQNNASANDYYETTTKPLMQLLQAKPERFLAVAEKLHEQKSQSITLSPYNLGGLFLKSNYRSYRQLVIYTLAASYDLTAMYTLIELQLDIKQHKPGDVAAFVQAAQQRNPYTAAALDYNPSTHEAGFNCLNTRDICNVYLIDNNTTRAMSNGDRNRQPTLKPDIRNLLVTAKN